MKSAILLILIIQMIVCIICNSCDIVTIERTYPPLPRHEKDKKPDTPVSLGCIRAYFGDFYKTFSQPVEFTQTGDSFSNIYLYGKCVDDQILVSRSDSTFTLSIHISGYSIDSLPVNQPLPEVYGKYPEIYLYPAGGSGYYSLAYYIKKCTFIITDKTDDILTGKFDGMLISSTGDLLPLSEGEFKIKVFRKETVCAINNGN